MSVRERIVEDLDEFEFEAGDSFALLAGMFVLHIGVEMSFARQPSLIWSVASLYVFGSALILIAAAISDVNMERWGRPLAGLCFTSLMVGLGVTYIMIRGAPIQTDALAYVNQAGEALLRGQSPYTTEMVLGERFPTPMVQGGHVSQFSYPVGSAMAAAPFVALVEDGGRIAILLGTAVTGTVVLWSLPSNLAPLGLFSLLVGDFVTWGVNDLTDPLWVAPLVIAMLLWPFSEVGPDRLFASGVLYGIAMAVKQQPWFCSVFLMLWVAREEGWRTAGRYVAVVASTFGVIHLPVVLLAPEAAVTGLLTNLWGPSGTLVHLGVGVSSLTLGGAFPMSKGGHTLLMLGAAGVFIAVYWQRFERVKWLAWVAWAPLLFFNYRSLANYFVVVAPVGAMILACQRGRVTQQLTEGQPDAV